MISLLSQLKGRNISGLYLLRLNCVILDLDDTLDFWGGLGFLALVLILGHPTPKGFDYHPIKVIKKVCRSGELGISQELKNLQK